MNHSEKTRQHPIPNRTRSLETKFRTFVFYLLPFIVLLLAISFSFTKTKLYKIHYLKYSLSWSPVLFQAIGSFFSPPKSMPTPSNCLLWMAPFLSGGGYSSEGWSYILALHEHMKKRPLGFKLAIEHHGDLESLEFWEGLPQDMKSLTYELFQTECRMNETIVVCHSEPGAWYPPLFETFPCPPNAYQNFRSVIGRTMFETDRVNPEHVKRCERMNYVWVPTEFHKSTFIESGVRPSKVVKVVQPIDVKFFDPLKYRPLDLGSISKQVLGGTKNYVTKNRFVFLSVFKWEYRKGWDVLLKSYLKEFSKVDKVALYLLTNPYHTDKDFGNKILDFVKESDIEEPVSGWTPIYVIDIHIAQTDLPRIYKAADAFVLPSRGEGWGRPLVEAMSMSLPVIATNWSGPTEYLADDNSYLLPVDRMSKVMEGPFKGHLWAEPSVSKLQVLMRHVLDNLNEAKGKGKKAREDMIRRFSPEIVADIVSNHVRDIVG